jgi:putative Mg2+ transporter-C (MgtC) family protein
MIEPDVHHYLPGWEMVLRLIVGMLCGLVIGFERQVRRRAAGLQTSTLVTVGSTLFGTVAPSLGFGNQLNVVANVVTGVGFLAGGVILKDGMSVSGLNTAATIWAAAAVGVLAGVGLFNEAILGALMIAGLNLTMGPLSDRIDARLARRNRARSDDSRD